MSKDCKALNMMTADELRDEVMNCHEHMGRCLRVLNGEKDVEPVEMVDVSDSVDLELFYKCMKVRG